MTSPNISVIKCHKCRSVLLDMSTVTNNYTTCDQQKCNSYNLSNFIFVSEDNLPDWIRRKVETEQWTKGRLNCEKCGCRVGVFDYVSGRKCDCGETVLPPVRFVASQVDRPIAVNISHKSL
ncbi:hypothetical protein K1T71_003260 [Dendrolimus kikuchii]|uniref:Uncharacterized protein n=1 Tax=Dendrolimus kikuchii TaxID=765133 RepID=A0ACC1DBG9_9NEOP|nr:hypothetical protein K1T71_003260 [Dendrolimus kikuchii]